ncbi:hypothetical protein [Rubrivirga sp. IMCC43871]|uniref:hypothetical protein n=1 Tax=Rubrivirga sp. IMCC43871 TaxID=3391575 RepID=UPI0039900E64
MTLRYTWTEGSIPPPGHYKRGVDLDGVDGRAWIKAGYGSAPVFDATFTLRSDTRDTLRAALDAAGVWDEWTRPERRTIGGSHWRLPLTDGDRQPTIHNDARGPDDRHPGPIAEAIEAIVPDALWSDLRAQRTAFIADR